MSVMRGLFLRRLLAVLPTKTFHSRSITLLLLLVCILGAVVVSTDLILSGLAARRSRAKISTNTIPTSIPKPPPMTSRGPLASANAGAVPSAPFQGCAVGCSATVPGTGARNSPVQFLSSATPSGCTTAPTYDWDFGDGTPNSSQQNPTHSYTEAGTYTWTLTTAASSGGVMIDTVAGGLGEGASARQAPFGTLGAIARDPQGRGIYVADATDSGTLIRFINTSNAAVTLGGRPIAPGTVRAIAGGGLDFLSDNVPGSQADVGTVTGLAASVNGDLVYFANKQDGLIRAVNVSGAALMIRSQSIGPGRVGTLATTTGSEYNGLAVHPSTGDVYAIDSASGVNKVFKITNSGDMTAVAGSGVNTPEEDPFSPGPALSVSLRLARAIEFDASGNFFIADSGHRRVIRVDGAGNAALVRQLNPIPFGTREINPYPSGVAIVGGNVYVANGNEQAIVRITPSVSKIAGITKSVGGQVVPASCDYSSTNCGDDGAAANAGFNILGSTDNPPIAAIEGDQNGLFILDQLGKGRVRYINLTGGTVTIAGLPIAAGAIRTIAGSGLEPPYDGGPAIGAALSSPVGVAVDGAGNLWVSDTNSGLLRFVNRGSSQVTIFAGTPAAQTVPAGAIVSVNKDIGPGDGDGVPVNQATFDKSQGLFITGQGIYVVDSLGGPVVPPGPRGNGVQTSLIRFINTTSAPVTIFPGAGGDAITVPPGNIQTIAGGGISDFSSGFATAVTFKGSSDVVVTGNGTIYVTDVNKKAVRKIDGATGTVSALALPAGNDYTGLGLDSSGRLLVANFTGGAVLRESGAGSGSFSSFATGLGKPRDVAGAPDGSAYVTDGSISSTTGNHRIVRIDSSGGTSVVAGGSAPGFGGDGGAAAGSQINISPPRLVLRSTPPSSDAPETVNIVVGQGGEILFADTNNNRIRSISGTLVTCVRTGTITISGVNEAPVLTSLNPSSRLNNSGAFTLTAIGNKFAPSSVVRWNGQNRPTNYVSATELSATIPASDLATTAPTAQVTVLTPGATPSETSSALTFTITANNDVPVIGSLSPNTAIEGGAGFTLTVNGSKFVNSSVVRWDGSARPTTFVSATRLTAQIDASDIIGAGSASVTVFNPPPGGGVSAPPVQFSITAATCLVPTLTSISPGSINAGAATFALTATGSNFCLRSKVFWNGQELQTASVSSTELTAQVPPNLVASQGTAQVTVVTSTPGGGTSAARTFTINPQGSNEIPTITTLNPPASGVGSAGFTLTVNGTKFVGGSKVRVNGADRTTAVVSDSRLTAPIMASDISAAGNVSVTVFNPAPGGGTSTPVMLRVLPKVTSVSAASYVGAQIAPDTIVAAYSVGMATGIAFASAVPLPTNMLGTTVRVTDSAGTERAAGLFYVSGEQVNFHMPPGTVEGLATVIVAINNDVKVAGQVNITKVAPGLFSADATGQGIAAAVLLRIRDGLQTFEPLVRFDTGQGKFVTVPIELGPNGDNVYVLFFGVGLRNASKPENIGVDFGGGVTKMLSSTLFEGAAPSSFVGVDQANVLLPRALIGRGLLNVTVTVDGKVANAVQIEVK